ncbi:translocation/assembly module TamB domain-containing protein [Chitinophagaceae bacterium MMS25-I14]
MFLTIVGLILLLAILINYTPVQNFLVGKVTDYLSKKLHTKVAIRHIRVDFLNHVLVQGLYVEDHARDTLLYAGEAQARITDWFFLKDQTPVISYIGLKNTYAHLYRTPKSNEWNYQFIIDAFDNGPKKQKQQKNDLEIDLKKLELENVRFHMDDAWTGDDMDFDIGKLLVDADNIDFKKKIIAVNNIDLSGFAMYMDSYEGGKPLDPNRKKKPYVIDTTVFNTDNWAIGVKKLALNDCAFHLKSDDDIPVVNEFDPAHMDITGIDIDVRNITIRKDTIHGQMKHLAANERCGIQVKDFRSAITVSPVASICDSLYLETNHSKLQRYYAMHYQRFPDFLDYIHKVVMTGKLNDAVVDARDVAYFAPQLRKLYPVTLKASGNAVGTVDNLVADHLDLTDGISTVKGDFSIKGLPDIDNSFMTFTSGDIATSGPAMIKYAPSLKNNPDVAIEKIQYLLFKGNFKGYISNFAANGTITSNLGTVVSDIKLDLPDRKNSGTLYAGNITSTNVQLGTLLRQPELGSITLKAAVKGNSFDPHNASAQINAVIAHMGIHGYDYKNITADGTLANKRFDGKMLVDDPNLALSFNGNIDFSQQLPAINAKAYLLKSDLTALKLITKDSVQATADLDLNMQGSNIDNFLGSAKLYNINLIRNKNRLDVDSIYVISANEGDSKTLTVQSNDVTAHIRGQYELSKLPYSIQYYLSGYLPNYIKKPTHTAPDQALSFDVTTREIERLLSIVAPSAHGFSNAAISGSLNTTMQDLRLNARIPYGAIGSIKMNNIVLDGAGNYRNLTVTGDVSNLALGDSVLNMSVNINTTLGNDSLRFNISTSSQLSYGTAVINGRAYARGDSLFLNILPSEFYLNQNKWEIPDGNHIVFSKNYLDIKNLYLFSGLQRISVTSGQEHTEHILGINLQELDLAQLSGIAGFSGYQPDGRINGSISIRDIFGRMKVFTNLKGTDIKLGTDTIGTVVIEGNYDAAKKVIELESESGVFRGNSSLTAHGTMSFDSTSNQRLDGQILVNHAPISWLSPVLSGLVSKLGGYANGTFQVKGTASVPDVAGNVALDSARLHVDYMGTDYTIPSGTLQLTNQAINVGRITVYDRFNNPAYLTGSVDHNHLRNFTFRLSLTSPNFEVMNLMDYENNNFYGQLMANLQSMTVRGPVDDISLNIKATPSQASHLYIPVKSTGDISNYSYITFKSYGTNQQSTTRKKNNRYNISILAVPTPDLEMTMILDPASGDQINAKGNGSINLHIASNADFNIQGKYEIEQGDYTFTFRQLFFKRTFIISSGSVIGFNGPISKTELNVNASYRTLARLYDLLSEKEIQSQLIPSSELTDAKTAQNVDVLLHMKGSLQKPELTFNLELPEKRSVGTYAYTKLERINANDRELFDQVASLLLIGYFIPPEGLVGTTATTGAINNMSEIISTTTSSQLTNIVNKLLGDKSLAIELKYKNYNLSDPSASGGINRNELRFGIRQNLFKDRVIVELGSYYDWGRPTSANTSATSALTLAGDFRVQYLVTQDGRIRLNGFRTSNYDVLVDRNISRAGIGISWRKSFDNVEEFFRSVKYNTHKQKEINKSMLNTDTVNIRRAEGTW